VTGSAGGATSENASAKLEHCDQTLGTLAVVEDQTAPWYYRLTREYKLTSTVPLIRLLVQQSNCFVVVERGRAFGAMQTGHALNQSGELRQGSNFGQGQIVAADYSLNPMITFSQKDTRGVGSALSVIPYAGLLGAVAGGLRTSEASTTLTMVDNRWASTWRLPKGQHQIRISLHGTAGSERALREAWEAIRILLKGRCSPARLPTPTTGSSSPCGTTRPRRSRAD